MQQCTFVIVVFDIVVVFVIVSSLVGLTALLSEMGLCSREDYELVRVSPSRDRISGM